MDKTVFLVTHDNSTKPTYGYRCKRAFESFGWNVKTFDYRFIQLHRSDLTKSIWNKVLLKRALDLNPDMVFVDKGESINPGIISKITSNGIKTANWCLDDPFGEFSAFNNIKNRNEYDSFFIFDPYYVPKLKETGQENAFYLPCSVDPELYREEIPAERRNYSEDVSFIGSHEPKRQETLEHLRDFNLSIWGYRWPHISKESPLFKHVKRETIRFDRSLEDLKAYCRTMNESKINLNIHSNHSRAGLNWRAFEVPATKSFMLCDYLSETDNLFRQGKEIVTYRSIEELKELIPYYLDNQEEREKIALAGHKRVVRDHTFKNRIKEALSKLKLQ
jgi:spore maturation protein CgeB